MHDVEAHLDFGVFFVYLNTPDSEVGIYPRWHDVSGTGVLVEHGDYNGIKRHKRLPKGRRVRRRERGGGTTGCTTMISYGGFESCYVGTWGFLFGMFLVA